MTPVIGIDLGTTNTVVAVVTGGRAQAIPDETGQPLIPSVVSFHPSGNVLVGRAAKERRLVDAVNTIYSVKRLIGRSWDTEEVRRARTRFAFQMREGPGQATLVVGRGETYTLPEISAFVLRKAKQVAEAALETLIERAVITVPANFNDLQRAATKVAGRVAGLEVLRILNEPTAAALAYGFGKANSERLAVYDFGGGTFDVTLLDLSENVFEVLATAGNTFLGGDDIDYAIADRIAGDFLKRHRYDPRSDAQAFERVRAAAEILKLRLSSEEVVTLQIEEVAHGPGGKALGIEFSMTRAEFELIAGPIVERTFDVCREALGIARMGAQDFEQILVVGGSTRIPLVRRKVEEFFAREVKASITPDEAVALGAAIQASALTGAERRRATVPPAPSAARWPLKRASETRPGSVRIETVPGVVLPSTQEPSTRRFASRPHLPTMPGVAPDPRSERALAEQAKAAALSLLGPKGARDPLASGTLKGLGARGRVPTAAGLGGTAEADKNQGAARTSTAFEAARRARDEASALLPVVEPDPVIPSREESVAFALGDHDIEDITHVPPPGRPQTLASASKTQSGWLDPGMSAYLEEEITKSLVFADEEPTKVGRSPALVAMEQEEPTHTRASSASAPKIPTEPPGVPAAAVSMLLDFLPSPEPLRTEHEPAPTLPPPPAVPHAPPHQAVAVELHRAPLLVDVTPITLSVETVQGYCDPVIQRNTTVPCEQVRQFATASDNQTSVRIRVAQGESTRFAQNTLLGEVELLGLTPAPRGSLQISVIFALDANGMLNVSAAESATGRATTAQLRLLGLPSNEEIVQMTTRQGERELSV